MWDDSIHSERRFAIRGQVEEMGRASIAGLSERLPDIPKEQIKVYLWRLVRDGEIVRPHRGVYTPA